MIYKNLEGGDLKKRRRQWRDRPGEENVKGNCGHYDANE